LAKADTAFQGALNGTSSLLKNLEIESFLILAGRCRGGAVELDVIF
jgi:hypothetical protein